MKPFPDVKRHSTALVAIHTVLHGRGFAAEAEQYGLADPLPFWEIVRDADGPTGRPRVIRYTRQQDDFEFLTVSVDLLSLYWSVRRETGRLHAKGHGLPHLVRALRAMPRVLPTGGV